MSIGERPQAPIPPAVRFWSAEVGDGDALGGPLDWVRLPEGHPHDRWWTPRVTATLSGALREHDPQLVILDQPWTHHALGLAAIAGRLRVLCMHNVEGALFEDLAQNADTRVPPALAQLVAQRSAAIEGRTVRSVDQLWACSEPDAELLRLRYPDHAPLAIVPNAWPGAPAPLAERDLRTPLLLFIGTLGYSPNADAARWLAATLLPALCDAGLDARLRIIGGNAPPSLAAVGPTDRVELAGEVADLEPHLAQAALAPVALRVGSGTRFKILEAFAAGVPVLSTAKGIEGIEATSGEHYLHAETLEEFVAAVCELCASPELHARLARSAQELLAARYSRAALRETIAAALDGLESRSARTSSPSARRSSARPAA